MIFSSVNEGGVPAFVLVARGCKVVTRRAHPKRVGVSYRVQPKRGVKAVCSCGKLFKDHLEQGSLNAFDCGLYKPLRVRVVSCERHLDWMGGAYIYARHNGLPFEGLLLEEAHREGFDSWAGLIAWFNEHKIDIDKTNRIAFELV